MNTTLVGPVLGAAGLAFGIWGWFLGKSFQRRQDKDERYAAIQMKSMATAWKISLGFMLALLAAAVLAGVSLEPLPLLLAVFLVHMVSWVCTFAVQKAQH